MGLLTWLFGAKNRQPTICQLVRENNAAEVEQLLLSAPNLIGSNQNEYNASPLHIAAHDGHADIVRLLLKFDPIIDATDRDHSTPLFSAALTGRSEIVDMLAANGANVTHRADEGVTPIHVAAMNGHIETVQVLLSHGADPATKDDTGALPRDLVEDQQGELYQLLSPAV